MPNAPEPLRRPAGGAPAPVPADWPNRAWSRSVRSGALDWHVQTCGRGDVVVFLHGTGSSAHSWADVMPALATQATLVAPDLPGHGFTTGATTDTLGLAQVAAELDRLMDALHLPAPRVVVGHSAGAALAMRWALDSARPPRAIVGFNPSLVPPPAIYEALLAPLVNPFATSATAASLLASLSSRTSLVSSLLASTRSQIPEAQRRRYAHLFGQAAHVRGTMGLMAGADLRALLRDAKRIDAAITLVIGMQDRWVSPGPLVRTVERALRGAEVIRWGGGHVLHEEHPVRAAEVVRDALAAASSAA